MSPLLKAAFSVLGRNLTPLSPRLVQFYSGGATASGERVSVDTALQLETVWSCVRLIAGTVATLPAQLYKRDAEGRGTIDYGHPLYTLLHDQANADMTAVVFWEAMVSCLMLWGNAFAKISRAGGRIVALTPIKPDRVTMVRRPDDGSIYYTVVSAGQIEVIDETEMMHVRGFSTDGGMGLSPVAQARETLGIAVAAEKAAGSLFRNGMRPSFALSMPQALDEVRRKRFKDEFLPEFTGAMNAGKSPVLEAGWEIKNIGLNPADAQLLATREFSIEQICRWFGVQPVMIGHMSKSTAWGTGLEQMNLWFLTYTLRAILRTIEQEARRSLMLAAEKSRYYLEFNVEGLLRADSAGRAALLAVYAQNGLRTRNEMRALDNYPPLPGGDDLTVQVNMLPAQMLGRDAAQAEDDPPANTPIQATRTPANTNRGTPNAKP